MLALPNVITILRILLVPVFAIAFVMPGDAARIFAFMIFAIAGASDWLDGFAARKLNAGSDFGRMLDPIADKVLVAVALMMLVAEGTFFTEVKSNGMLSLLKLVPAIIILSREILVSGLREFLAGTRVSMPVTAIAKFKTAVQMVAIGAMLLTPLAHRIVPGMPGATYEVIAFILLWVAAALTVYTGVIYFRNGMAHIDTNPRGLKP
jgi:cardiolipin synthase (CMP-forming)